MPNSFANNSQAPRLTKNARINAGFSPYLCSDKEESPITTIKAGISPKNEIANAKPSTAVNIAANGRQSKLGCSSLLGLKSTENASQTARTVKAPESTNGKYPGPIRCEDPKSYCRPIIKAVIPITASMVAIVNRREITFIGNFL